MFVCMLRPYVASKFCGLSTQTFHRFYGWWSPWYKGTGWLGVKHQLTYLLMNGADCERPTGIGTIVNHRCTKTRSNQWGNQLWHSLEEDAEKWCSEWCGLSMRTWTGTASSKEGRTDTENEIATRTWHQKHWDWGHHKNMASETLRLRSPQGRGMNNQRGWDDFLFCNDGSCWGG